MSTAPSATETVGAAIPGVDVTVEAGVLRVTLNRPARMNALTYASLEAIAEAFESHADDPAVRAAVLTGTGRAFCTGADLSATEKSEDRPADTRTIDAANRAVAAIRAFPRVVVGVVNGPAAGVGVSLALICDLIVATESSYFLLAFTKVGLMPDGGATAIVAASIGRARALNMAILAERLPAPKAAEYGLIAATYPDDEFATAAAALVDRVAAGPSEAFHRTKAAINDATLTEYDNALARERKGQLELLVTADHREGVAAFLGKRPANFGGR
jgi:enoyl-CoA hydratase